MNDPLGIPVIRPATATDTAAILEFLEPFVSAGQLLRRTAEELQALTTHGFLANVQDQTVGFAAIEMYGRKLAEIQCLAVLAEYRRLGVGRELVALCVDAARQNNIMEVMAISASDEFLRSCGFDYSLPDQKRALFYQLRPRN